MKNIERKKMDGYERYLRVLRTIEDLEKSTVKTTDWYDEHYNDSHTWTKYVLKTESASLEFWFLGDSNGYYNESVSIKKI